MKVNKILAFMFILELCIIPLQGCGAKSITADSTETQETQANLLGKRVDYSARSVIVVGPELKTAGCG